MWNRLEEGAPSLDKGSGRPFLRKLLAGVGDAAGDVGRPCRLGKEIQIAYKYQGTLGVPFARK